MLHLQSIRVYISTMLSVLSLTLPFRQFLWITDFDIWPGVAVFLLLSSPF